MDRAGLTALRRQPGYLRFLAAASLVVVAYRKATISLADEVVHLDEGRIVGRGTHAELLETSPAYAQLVNAYETQTVGPGVTE